MRLSSCARSGTRSSIWRPMPRPEAPSGTAAGMAYRAAGPPDGAAVLLVHGHPESSHMWAAAMSALAEAGCRAVAPDLAGYGHSPPDPPGTWERHVERLERFRSELGLGRTVLAVHDWGGLIGLRWACDHPAATRALVISSSGFFPDGKWHGLAEGATHARGRAKRRSRTSPARDSTASSRRPARGSTSPPSTSTGRPSRITSAAPRSWSSTARATSRSWRSTREGSPRWGSRCCSSGASTRSSAPVAGAHRFKRELPDAELAIVGGGWALRVGGRARAHGELARELRRRSPLALPESAHGAALRPGPPHREGQTRVPAPDLPLAARMRPPALGEFVGPGAPARAAARRCARRSRRAGRTRWSCTGRPAPARPRSRGCSPERARGVRGGVAP